MALDKLTTIYPHLLSEEKRMIEQHRGQCEYCQRFFFKTDLRPVFFPGRETTDSRAYLCTKCRGKRFDKIYEKTSEIFGLEIPLIKALDECLKSSKRISDASNGRKAHNLSLDDILRLWVLQEGICNLSGIVMDIRGDDMTHPSIDRIDSKISYVMGNVQLVTRAINMMKGPLPQLEFLAMCRTVSRFKKKI